NLERRHALIGPVLDLCCYLVGFEPFVCRMIDVRTREMNVGTCDFARIDRLLDRLVRRQAQCSGCSDCRHARSEIKRRETSRGEYVASAAICRIEKMVVHSDEARYCATASQIQRCCRGRNR